MTTLQITVMTCAYALALAAVIYFTRATLPRVAGALAGGAVAGCWGLGAIIAGEALGFWRDFLPARHSAWVLFYFGLAVSLSPIYLITWRVARRFGWLGLAVCLIIAALVGPPRDYLYVATFPEWGAFSSGLAPVIADAAAYVGIVALGHAVMQLVSGPARGSRLARQPPAR
jgi:Kef-type K+ transport system membrane component KefB